MYMHASWMNAHKHGGGYGWLTDSVQRGIRIPFNP